MTITLEIFLMGLLIVSTLTGLVTEAVKAVLNETGKTYHSNILAGIIAVILSAVLGIGYGIIMEITVTDKVIVVLIALILMSWLSAMVGYDKVIQAISQFKVTKD